MKRWFDEQGFDLRSFVKHGMDAETFLATGDAHAELVVRMKLERPNG